MDVEIKRPFEVCFRILKIFGLWFDGKKSTSYRIYGHFLIFFCPILFFIILIAGIYQRQQTADIMNLVEPITFVMAGMVMIPRIVDFKLNFKRILALYCSMDEIVTRHVNNDIFIKKRLNFFFKLFLLIETFGVISIVSGYLVSAQSHILPYPVAVPFDVSSDFGFWTVYIYLFIALAYVG